MQETKELMEERNQNTKTSGVKNQASSNPIRCYGAFNIRRTTTTCGKKADWYSDVINVHEVTCISCVSLLAYPRHETSRTPLWRERLKELKGEN